MLSGGDRQRLTLSRVWFQESDIVIFDEATSALDNLTEGAVMKEILDYLSDITVLVIVHRSLKSKITAVKTLLQYSSFSLPLSFQCV